MTVLSDMLVYLRKREGLSQQELSEKLELTRSAISMYETGKREPDLETLEIFADFYNVDMNTLTGRGSSFTPSSYQPTSSTSKAPIYSSEALKLATDYDQLDSHGKKIVRLVADEEKNRVTGERASPPQTVQKQNAEETVYFMVPGYSLPMSAGLGEPADLQAPEDFQLKKAPPRGTSYIARVHGGSMEPTYFDGELVFVHATEEIPVGKIGAFLMDGEQYIKELGDGVLISHNSDPQYAPRTMTEDIRCQGLVLGVCDESYFT